MNYEELNKVKDLYNQGFKCIKYEEESNGCLKAFFKNFESESIETLVSQNKKEIKEIKKYIDNN